jgi:glucose/arabinose dehydrogenase
MYSTGQWKIIFPMALLSVVLLLLPRVCQAIPDGDLDNDQVVTIADALISLRIAVNIIPVNQQALDHGDVFPLTDGAPAPDGTINISDALTILRKVVGLVQWDLVPGLPTTVTVIPAGGSAGVTASTIISVSFSEPVDGKSVTTSTFFVRDDAGTPVTGNTATIGATAVFTPDENLAFLTGYTATVTTGIRDQGGNPLTVGQSWSFTTRDWPQIALAATTAGLVQPVAISHSGDGTGRLFVVEQAGAVRIVRNGAVLGAPFLDISGIVRPTGGEQGLLGIAFPPGFAAKSYFYVHYTNRQNVGDTVIARYRLTTDPDLADPASGQALLTTPQPFANHNGGQLAFGPDGLLYIGLGDGGSGGDPLNNGQSLTSLLGKVLRIDTESGVAPYRIPAANPILGGRVSEIWAYGLRNPWRFSFDRKTGDLYIGDVGQGLFEEINFQPAGANGGTNYGWNIMEGMHCFTDPACNQAGLVLPVQEYQHIDGNCSVTGGHVYRGTEFPELRGVYFYGDFCSGRIWGMRQINGQWQNRLLLDTTLNISTFGEDEAGSLYLADYATGTIQRVVSP